VDLAEPLRAARLFNRAHHGFSFVNKNIWSEIATEGASISKLEVLLAHIFSSLDLAVGFHGSGTGRDTHSTYETAFLFNVAVSGTVLFQFVPRVFHKNGTGRCADTVAPMNLLFQASRAVVFSHLIDNSFLILNYLGIKSFYFIVIPLVTTLH
jgi:hypothetical protein